MSGTHEEKIETSSAVLRPAMLTPSQGKDQDPRLLSGGSGTTFPRFAVVGGLLILILVASLVLQLNADRIPVFVLSHEPYCIQLIGDSEGWQARYPGTVGGALKERVARSDEIHLPQGTPIVLKLRTRDVACLLRIPEKGLKQIALPGREFPMQLQAQSPGEMHLESSPGCGPTLEPMRKRIVIVPKDEFARWWQSLPAAPRPRL